MFVKNIVQQLLQLCFICNNNANNNQRTTNQRTTAHTQPHKQQHKQHTHKYHTQPQNETKQPTHQQQQPTHKTTNTNTMTNTNNQTTNTNNNQPFSSAQGTHLPTVGHNNINMSTISLSVSWLCATPTSQWQGSQ
jgi:hypothetical protein